MIGSLIGMILMNHRLLAIQDLLYDYHHIEFLSSEDQPLPTSPPHR